MMKWGRVVIWLMIPLLVGVVILFVYWRSVHRGERNLVTVSLVRLISNPEEFDGVSIITQGVFDVSKSSSIVRLYIHTDDYRYGLNYNSIYIAIGNVLNGVEVEQIYESVKEYDGKYVSVAGKFKYIKFPVEKTYIDMPTLYMENIGECNLEHKEKDCGPSVVLPEESASRDAQPQPLPVSS